MKQQTFRISIVVIISIMLSSKTKNVFKQIQRVMKGEGFNFMQLDTGDLEQANLKDAKYDWCACYSIISSSGSKLWLQMNTV